MLKAVLEKVCHLNLEKVCESRVVLSREFQFQIVGAHTEKARQLKTSFVRKLAVVDRRSLEKAYGVKRLEKYKGVLEDGTLYVNVEKFISYAPFHWEPMKLLKEVS